MLKTSCYNYKKGIFNNLVLNKNISMCKMKIYGILEI